MRFSYLVADYPEISEIEINPLLAGPDGSVALDARAVVDQSLVGRPPPPFSHLAIRPYPEEYTREATTTGGLQRDAASDQAGGRAALARDARRLLGRVHPVALPRDDQAHARVRHALLLHRLRPRTRDRRRARSAGRHAQAPRRRPARRRPRPPERRVRGARRRSLAGARPVGPADRLLPARSRGRGASAGSTRRRRPTTHA